MHAFLRLLALTAGLSGPALAADTASLDLRFTGIEAPKGAIMVAVFASEADYAAGKAVRGLMIPATGATAGQVLDGLVPGRYAIKAFHDIDGDGQMGANPFGQPTEPFAFSNNAPANMGPAPWSAAAFDVGAGTTVQTIAIK
jgi:uncharacterized protein (DUF2141 family)